MKKVQEKADETDWNTRANKQLLASFLAIKTSNEAKLFLRDLMTEGEIEEFASRLEAARLLSKDVQYNAIIKATGLSSTTIARISKWLKGSLGGYRLILSRLYPSPSFSINSKHPHISSQLRKGLSLNS